jgi:hypothetical protein
LGWFYSCRALCGRSVSFLHSNQVLPSTPRASARECTRYVEPQLAGCFRPARASQLFILSTLFAVTLILSTPDRAMAEARGKGSVWLPAIAGLFSSQASVDADPVDPFTLYGTVLCASTSQCCAACCRNAACASAVGMRHAILNPLHAPQQEVSDREA